MFSSLHERKCFSIRLTTYRGKICNIGNENKMKDLHTQKPIGEKNIGCCEKRQVLTGEGAEQILTAAREDEKVR